METQHAFSPLKTVQNPAVPESELIVQNKDLRPVGSVASSPFGNSSTTSVEVKQEATDQGTCTYLSELNIFCKFIYIVFWLASRSHPVIFGLILSKPWRSFHPYIVFHLDNKCHYVTFVFIFNNPWM